MDVRSEDRPVEGERRFDPQVGPEEAGGGEGERSDRGEDLTDSAADLGQPAGVGLAGQVVERDAIDPFEDRVRVTGDRIRNPHNAGTGARAAAARRSRRATPPAVPTRASRRTAAPGPAGPVPRPTPGNSCWTGRLPSGSHPGPVRGRSRERSAPPGRRSPGPRNPPRDSHRARMAAGTIPSCRAIPTRSKLTLRYSISYETAIS